ncbi:MAG: protein of unknown function [Nitrospira sp.]
MPHRSWMVQKTPRPIDRIGLAVALAFLVALGLWAGFRGEKSEDAGTPAQEGIQQPNQAPPRIP